MSDDYTDPSGDHASGHDDVNAREPIALQIAIYAKSQDAADNFWRDLEKRLHKKAKVSARRFDGAGANAAIHLLTEEDVADADATGATIGRVATNVATVNILLDLPIADTQARQRMAELLADFARRPGYERFASQKDAGGASLAKHARSIARFLSERFAVPGSVTSVEGNEKRDDDLSSETAKSRSEWKAQRRAGRSVRRAQKKAAKDKLPAAADTTAPAQVSEINRSEKKARKRAEKDARRAAKAKPGEQAVAEVLARGAGRSKREALKRATKSDVKVEEEKVRKRAGKSPDVARNTKAGAEAGTIATEDKIAKRLARKAEKQGVLINPEMPSKKGQRQRRKAPSFESEGAPIAAATEDDGSATKATRKAKERVGKKSKRSGEGAKAKRGSLSIRIAGLDEKSLAGLHRALERKSPDVVLEAAGGKQKIDVAVYAFEDSSFDAAAIGQCLGVIAKEGARVRVFLDRERSPEGDIQDINRAIAKLAGACDGRVVRLACSLNRYDDGSMLASDGLTDAACDLIADSILGIAASALSKRSQPPVASPVPPDLAEARALADSSAEFLAQLRWNETMMPRLIRAHASKEAMEALLDEKLVVRSETVLSLNVPIAWPDNIPDRVTGIRILGLEFLTEPLAYWFIKAGGRSSNEIGEIDALLKERGIKASEILSRAEKIMLDFIRKYPPNPASEAWQEVAVSRRARVFILYVFCCKAAITRHIRFDAEAFKIIFRSLLDLIERLRADDFYKPASLDGFQQDGLVIGLGLALRGSRYGDRLLVESLDRLLKLQLEAGLTADGVWRAGTFSEHCSLLALLKTMLSDFDKSDAALVGPFAATAKRMMLFAEAMLKTNARPPAFDDSRQKSYAGELFGTRRALAQADGRTIPKSKIEAMPRVTETYVFRDAQYFISHSTQKVSKDSSLVVLHADSPSILAGDPGGVTLAFAHGEVDLLVRAEPGKVSRRDKSSLFDPALRNGYHVNGTGFDKRGEFRTNTARIVKSWRGTGWAAAKAIDEINSAATVSRVVVHLKDVHVLLVVDRLESHDGKDAAFEQFWHIAPGLAAPAVSTTPLRFSATAPGGMIVAFDGESAIAVEAEGEGTCVRRAAHIAKGAMASLFQWTQETVPTTVNLACDELDGWSVTVSGAGFGGKLTLAGDELRFDRTESC